MRDFATVLACGVAGIATLAEAKDSNADRLCSERPELTTSACITAPGRLQTETALVDWTLVRGGGGRDDKTLIGDTLAPYGMAVKPSSGSAGLRTALTATTARMGSPSARTGWGTRTSN